MTRKQLLAAICPSSRMHDCENYHCFDCNLELIKWLDKYDKHVIEQYKADTELKETIRDIHDNVAREMYCKGIDDMFKEICTYRMYDEYGNVIDALEIAEKLKAGVNNE